MPPRHVEAGRPRPKIQQPSVQDEFEVFRRYSCLPEGQQPVAVTGRETVLIDLNSKANEGGAPQNPEVKLPALPRGASSYE